jgi:hypothetical protein
LRYERATETAHVQVSRDVYCPRSGVDYPGIDCIESGMVETFCKWGTSTQLFATSESRFLTVENTICIFLQSDWGWFGADDIPVASIAVAITLGYIAQVIANLK